MEWTWNFLTWSIIILSPALLLFHLRRKSGTNRLPPSPPGWPIFGHIFDLGSLPPRTLAGLQQQYGPVLWLKLGYTNTLVIQNAKSAADFFKNHDLSFADRSVIEVMRSHGFYKGAMSTSSHNNYWRFLRRISTVKLFINKKITETSSVGQKCVDEMRQWIEATPSFNMFGLQGLKKKAECDVGKALDIASVFVKERLKERQEGVESRRDFLDTLLDFEGSGKDEPEKLTEHEVNIVILEMFLVGTETISTTIEWAMSELLCNPEAMTKIKAEVSKVARLSGKLEEKDVGNLTYLHAVIKETMRLHPPVPFLVPRRSTPDTNFMGYHIPKNTQVFVNCWAIGRDPKCWGDDPPSFKPERLLDSKVDYKGNHFELIPFGAGRRMCVGIPLAQPMMFLILGSLVHEFDWELDNDLTRETMDMKEKLGITAGKLEPLKAIPRRAK